MVPQDRENYIHKQVEYMYTDIKESRDIIKVRPCIDMCVESLFDHASTMLIEHKHPNIDRDRRS